MLALNKIAIQRTFNIVGGFVDYFQKPQWTKIKPFNGQVRRRQIFDALTGLNFVAIIETGTHLGATTQYFAETRLPVFTVEGHPRRYGFVKARFFRFRNVSLRRGDSRNQLRKILHELGPEKRDQPLFFYLDAHWGEDLPLAGELRIILESCAQPTIMIDDFQVMDDPGYGFDAYGENKNLVRAYIEPFIVRNNLCLFYPAAPSSDETGAKRGCVVLAREEAKERFSLLPQLRLAPA
jgi:hypothetical protein